LRSCRSVVTLFHSSLLFDHRHQCSSVCLTSRWCSASLFNHFVTRPRCSLINEKILHLIVLHSLCSTLSTSCFKQLTRNVLLRYCTLRTSSRYLRRRSIFKPSNSPLSTAHIMVDLTYYCTALTTTASIAVRTHKTLSSCH